MENTESFVGMMPMSFHENDNDALLIVQKHCHEPKHQYVTNGEVAKKIALERF